MALLDLWWRIVTYLRRHGFRATFGRVVDQVKRASQLNCMALLYCDLSGGVYGPAELPEFITIVRKRDEAELSEAEFIEFADCWNPRLASKAIKDRFGRNASLWMMKLDGELGGYVWTLQGSTMEPYFFRLGQADVHLFDGYVAPKFRGRGLHGHLLNHVLRNLASESVERIQQLPK